jgi:hypothetical protein
MAHHFACLMVSNGVQESCADGCRDAHFLAIANKLFGEEERADIVALVAADPECGDLILGTGARADFERSGSHAKGWGKAVGEIA